MSQNGESDTTRPIGVDMHSNSIAIFAAVLLNH